MVKVAHGARHVEHHLRVLAALGRGDDRGAVASLRLEPEPLGVAARDRLGIQLEPALAIGSEDGVQVHVVRVVAAVDNHTSASREPRSVLIEPRGRVLCDELGQVGRSAARAHGDQPRRVAHRSVHDPLAVDERHDRGGRPAVDSVPFGVAHLAKVAHLRELGGGMGR